MLGAQNLVLGAFIVTLKNKIRIDVRMVNMETGVTLKAEQITGSTKHVISLIRKLSKKMMKGLNISITKQEEKLLNKTQKVDLQAVILFSQGLEFEDQGDVRLAHENYQKAIQIEPDFNIAKEHINKLNQKNSK